MTNKRPEPRIETRTYKLADGRVTTTYSLRYYDAAGNRRRKTCATREEADFERARIVLEQSRGGVMPVSPVAAAPLEPESSDTTIAEFWQSWLADARVRLQRNTIKEYERQFRTRLEPRFGSLLLDALKRGWSANGALSSLPRASGPRRSAAR